MCHLVEANYKAGCAETYSYSFTLPDDFEIDNLDLLLGNVLKLWSKDIGWDLVRCEDDLCILSLSGSETVNGVSLVVEERYLQNGKYHSYVLGIDSIPLTDQVYIDLTSKLLELSGASTLVLLDADWTTIRVYLAAKNSVWKNIEQPKILIRELKVESDVLERIADKSVSSILSTPVRKDFLVDALANMRTASPVKLYAEQSIDIVRSFLTAALIHMRDAGLHSFGGNEGKSVLCVTGPIARLIHPSALSLAVIDGLQLRGTFETYIDSDMRAYALGTSVNNKVFAFPWKSVFETSFVYVSPEKGASGRRGEITFRGVINDHDAQTIDTIIVGLTGHVIPIRLKENEQLLIEPAKPVFFPRLKQVFENNKKYLTLDDSIDLKDVIIDCRSLPVVYGPDPLSNASRISSWIQPVKSIIDGRAKGKK